MDLSGNGGPLGAHDSGMEAEGRTIALQSGRYVLAHYRILPGGRPRRLRPPDAESGCRLRACYELRSRFLQCLPSFEGFGESISAQDAS